MTGFQEWVRAGLELGAREMLDVLEELDAAGVGTEGEDLAALIADKLQERWPPWKVEKTSQSGLALDLYPCDACKAPVAFSSTRTTAQGRICVSCLEKLITGEL